jgi:formate hydrogenlyase subunit 3/multisubunit Na+/H+ antiporter MnhD subunit
MSPAEVSVMLAFAVVVPFAGAVLIAAAGGAVRTRRILALSYAAAATAFDLALLSGYLQHPARASWGSLKLTSFSCPAFVVLNLLAVAGVLYGSFRRTTSPFPAFLVATIPAACGFGALALSVTTLAPQVLLWLGATAAAMLGLLAHGSVGARKRLRAFIPWLVSDGLFVVGAILCSALLKEGGVLIKPPLTSGSEAQVVVVVVLFLLSALVRLGVFPLHLWIGDLVNRTDATWSSFFLGGLNFLLAGARLVVAVTLLARLVASDWSIALTIVALVSIAAGPFLAVRARTVSQSAAGLYCMQSGFLLLAVAMFSRAGLEGALFMLITGPLFLTAFLMAAGTADDLRGSSVLGERPLSARVAPAAFVALLVSGLCIAGLPPMDGFIGKALTVLGGFDKSVDSQFFALAAGIALVALALALVAVVRTVGGSFSAEERPASGPRPGSLEGLVPLTICGASLLFGLFPGILLRNFINGSSRIFFAIGFEGPGIAFRGTGDVVASAFNNYMAWGAAAAAFLLAVSVITLVAYFAARAKHPSSGLAVSRRPFVGGSAGGYSSSWGPSWRPALRAFRRAP